MNPTSMDSSMRSALAQSPFMSQESEPSGLRDALSQVD